MDKQARIIVVDDDEDVVKSLKTILESEGYLVDYAVTGKEAIRKTQKTTYNIALIDIKLPDMPGIDLLSLIRDDVPRTRKVIITGYPNLQNAILAINKHADGFLLKPIDIKKLLEIVEEQLEFQRDEDEYSEKKIAEFLRSKLKELKDDSEQP